MANNDSLHKAKSAKNDEFYTQYCDIEAEMNAYLEYNSDVFRNKTVLLPCDDPEWSNFTKWFAQNFERIGLKKLISTSYANEKKIMVFHKQISIFELDDPKYDKTKTNSHGKIFILERGNKHVDINDLKWDYLDGDGDFRSEEVTKLRDEADFIITNCPFSLFREFISWALEGNKKISVIGNVNALTYKETFPLIKNNQLWLGPSIHSGDRRFYVPEDYPLNASTCGIDDDGRHYINVKGVRWFTNIDHGRRHQPLQLMTMEENIRYSKHKKIKGHGYDHYDNYDAIEVPFTDAIPDDYEGAMGVPITFLDKFNPDQFEIIGGFNGHSCPDEEGGYVHSTMTEYVDKNGKTKTWNGPTINKKTTYYRVLIRKK